MCQTAQADEHGESYDPAPQPSVEPMLGRTLNQQFRGRDPRGEVSDTLPFVPSDLWPDGGESLLPSGPAGAAGEFAIDCLRRLSRQATSGDPRAGAAIALLRARACDEPDKVAETLEAFTGTDATLADLYRLAATAFDEARFDEATRCLAVLAATTGAEIWGMLGLATVGVRHRLDDLALTLLGGMIDVPDRHPRVSSIAAICALARGRKADAQAHLAAASRLARKHTELRAELQLAQRALLLMHLKHS